MFIFSQCPFPSSWAFCLHSCAQNFYVFSVYVNVLSSLRVESFIEMNPNEPTQNTGSYGIGHTFSGIMKSLKDIQSQLDNIVSDFHSPNKEDNFQQILQKMEQVRNCQQSLCVAHFEMEKSVDKGNTGQTQPGDDPFQHFDVLSSRLAALNDAIKNLHPHQQDTTDSSKQPGKFR